jgi:hypothetical protein
VCANPKFLGFLQCEPCAEGHDVGVPQQFQVFVIGRTLGGLGAVGLPFGVHPDTERVRKVVELVTEALDNAPFSHIVD